MLLTDYLLSEESIQWHYARQLGIEHAVIRLPEGPDFAVDNPEHWRLLHRRFTDFGLKPIVVEPMPNSLHNAIKEGRPDRDACLEKVIRMMAIMDQLDVRTICVNFMAHVGWCRTSSEMPERGGACVTGFRLADYRPTDTFTISEEQLWANLLYFLQAVVPFAEKYGIRLALHPDDPPVPRLGNVSRILTSADRIEQAINLVPSPNVGVTLCQGSYAAMGEDIPAVIERFGRQDKIFFVHFRDIRGDRENFRETFHDNGQTDMAAAVRAYARLGYQGPVRVDHVPTMAGEDNQTPGYATVGRLFAIGYLKGLLDATGSAL